MQLSTEPNKYDVAIIGGGPAGSVAAAWLARNGYRVAQFEKERHPRFHIGESLLPNGNGVLKEIGVWEKIESAGFTIKRGAEFTIPDRSSSVMNIFAEGLIPGMDRTFQVERAVFDDTLFRHALECGSDSQQRKAVVSAKRQGKAWHLGIEDLESSSQNEIQSDWIIDASGRNCLMGRHLKMKKESLPYPGRLAVFNHFHGFPRGDGERAGDIIILRLKEGWFWAIPISDEVMSVGVVAHKGAGMRKDESRADFFWRKTRESTWLTSAMASCKAVGEFRIESDYSFSYETFGDENVLLAGDAASFIDPVFSSGVYLALESGLLSAKLIAKRTEKGKQGDRNLYVSYTKQMKDRIGVMRKLIDSFYDNESFEVFMTPKPPANIGRAVNAIVAGCLKLPFAVRWRFRAFRFVCSIHKRFKIVPKIEW